MFVFSNCLYQSKVPPERLSWKQWIINLLFLTCAAILRQYILRWVSGQLTPLYFSKSGTLNFGGMTTSGTRHMSTALIPTVFSLSAPSLAQLALCTSSGRPYLGKESDCPQVQCSDKTVSYNRLVGPPQLEE